ncbi:uncharacterized protein EURHEDRAFT_201334 [Aspergillus ruber CBS 135680]|uniref:Uncharacterized protein n=1 Tax=Aspergillus ruber (strain CBS 135680) TaxID=1388766 RepID=A0A017S5N8_ASPRC|nr:uncharacterized protein EURHEDRAFT_201334 [Aspergillus ruber CBS 135680]EYE92272.1 hypothetical protein EURHEDRAFT_201334 [Aspergillus ruber CBS 135680]
MPGNFSHSPFAHTRVRQDFNETLFVTATFSPSSMRKSVNNATYRLTLFTTVGYFELPSNELDNKFGPILETDLFSSCHYPECRNGSKSLDSRSTITDRNNPGRMDGDFHLEYVPTKGPPALLTVALF